MVNTKVHIETSVRCSIILLGGNDLSKLNTYLLYLGESKLHDDYELIIINDCGLEIDERQLGAFLPTMKVLNAEGILNQQQLFDAGATTAKGRFLLFVSSFIEFDKRELEESINDLESSEEKVSVSANKNFVLAERSFYIEVGGFEKLLQDKKVNAGKDNYKEEDSCVQISSIISAAVQANRVKPWSAIKGDKTLRLDYNLDRESIVFDLGAYEGQWASDIFAKYCCTIHCFEPVKAFAENIETRFAKNNKVFVHHLGLSNGNKKAKISHNATASSIFQGQGKEEIQLVRAVGFMAEHNIKKIDLIKINIEGGEYDLSEHLIETGFVKNIVNLQIQFHDFVPNAKERMEKIQRSLEKTHKLTYQYEFVWENWKLR